MSLIKILQNKALPYFLTAGLTFIPISCDTSGGTDEVVQPTTPTEPTPPIQPEPTQPTIPDYTAEKAVITKAADRLITLQNASGSWDWDVTNATGPGTFFL
jgi:hypothetical protein